MKKNINYQSRSDRDQISNIKKKNLFFVIFFIFLIYVFFINLRSSIIFQKKDRLNIVFYGPKTAFYSFGYDDKVNYFINFPSDIKILVPGGFGYYRLGALGKLVSLEKNPSIFKKSMSAATSSFIDYYFYPVQNKIFFGKQEGKIFFPSLEQIFIDKTNANAFDRAYIFFLFGLKQKNQFLHITSLPIKKEADELLLDEKDFSDQLIGFFYHMTYRSEKRNVQIVYTKTEKTLSLIAKIIEGQGIRVVDFSYQKNKNNCQVTEEEKTISQTAKALSQFFNCPITKGKTDPYDIILKLGEKESEWSVD